MQDLKNRLRKLRRRFHRQSGHKYRSWQPITRAARIRMWASELWDEWVEFSSSDQ